MIFALMVACNLRPPPQAFDSVDEAPLHDAKITLIFPAVALTEMVGEHGYSTGTVGPMSPWQRTVVVPLVASRDEMPDQIPAWVHTRGSVNEPLEPWLKELRETFDGVTPRRVDALERNRKAGWYDAIADAERRYGIQSHPDAQIVILK